MVKILQIFSYMSPLVVNPLQDAQFFEPTMRPSCLGTTRYLLGRASRPAHTQVPRAIMKVVCRTGGGEIALHPTPGGLGETPSRRAQRTQGICQIESRHTVFRYKLE